MYSIEGLRIQFAADSKYRFGTSQKAIRAALTDRGANVMDSGATHFLLGRSNPVIHYIKPTQIAVMERELFEPSASGLRYFSGLESKLYAMIRRLVSANRRIYVLDMGDPMTDEAISKLERTTPLPPALREFYLVFGHLRVLWAFRSPTVTRSVFARPTPFLTSDAFPGCINIPPLKEVLGLSVSHGPPLDGKRVAFDMYSDRHQMCLDLDGRDDPVVGRWCADEEEVVSTGLAFSRYIRRLIGFFGYVNRFTETSTWIDGGNGYLFDLPNVVVQPDMESIQQADQGFVPLSDNSREVAEHLERERQLYRDAMESGDGEAAWRRRNAFEGEEFLEATLDVLSLQGRRDDFLLFMERALGSGFDPNEYEARTSQRQFLSDPDYAATRERFFPTWEDRDRG